MITVSIDFKILYLLPREYLRAKEKYGKLQEIRMEG